MTAVLLILSGIPINPEYFSYLPYMLDSAVFKSIIEGASLRAQRGNPVAFLLVNR